jgi:uncharacterized protein (DUF1810 family)
MPSVFGEPEWASRFLPAQSACWADVMRDLQAGRAQPRWTPFVFPQHLGLAAREIDWFYGVQDLEHAYRYAKHALLGARLREATAAVLRHNRSARSIFGVSGALRFRSCMTLFACATLDDTVFEQALSQFFNGTPCLATLELLGAEDKF